MKNNIYLMSVIGGLSVFIGNTFLKKVSNQQVNKIESIKLSLFMSIIILLILQFYEKEQIPILSEPFISS